MQYTPEGYLDKVKMEDRKNWGCVIMACGAAMMMPEAYKRMRIFVKRSVYEF
jgi:hypothetical protein